MTHCDTGGTGAWRKRQIICVRPSAITRSDRGKDARTVAEPVGAAMSQDAPDLITDEGYETRPSYIAVYYQPLCIVFNKKAFSSDILQYASFLINHGSLTLPDVTDLMRQFGQNLLIL